MPPRDPADRLNVAQASGTGLDIGLKVVLGIVESVVPGGLFGAFGMEECGGIPHSILADVNLQSIEQARRTGEQARFHHRRHHSDIVPGLDFAVPRRSHRVADFKTNIPKKGEESADGLVHLGGAGLCRYHHEIDIRMRMQFPAAVSPDRDQRAAAVDFRGKVIPCGQYDLIDDTGAIVDQRIHRFVGVEAFRESVLGVFQNVAKRLDGAAAPPEGMLEQR